MKHCLTILLMLFSCVASANLHRIPEECAHLRRVSTEVGSPTFDTSSECKTLLRSIYTAAIDSSPAKVEDLQHSGDTVFFVEDQYENIVIGSMILKNTELTLGGILLSGTFIEESGQLVFPKAKSFMSGRIVTLGQRRFIVWVMQTVLRPAAPDVYMIYEI